MVVNSPYERDGFLAVDSRLCEMILIAFPLSIEIVDQTARHTIRHQEIVYRCHLPCCH